MLDFAINVRVDAPTDQEDDLRDVLASIVEQALALLPGESAVGTVRR